MSGLELYRMLHFPDRQPQQFFVWILLTMGQTPRDEAKRPGAETFPNQAVFRTSASDTARFELPSGKSKSEYFNTLTVLGWKLPKMYRKSSSSSHTGKVDDNRNRHR